MRQRVVRFHVDEATYQRLARRGNVSELAKQATLASLDEAPLAREGASARDAVRFGRAVMHAGAAAAVAPAGYDPRRGEVGGLIGGLVGAILGAAVTGATSMRPPSPEPSEPVAPAPLQGRRFPPAAPMSGAPTWERLGYEVARFVQRLRERIFVNPKVAIVVLIRNDETDDQMQVGEIEQAALPAFLRRAADRIERDAKARTETVKGTVALSPSGDRAVVTVEYAKDKN